MTLITMATNICLNSFVDVSYKKLSWIVFLNISRILFLNVWIIYIDRNLFFDVWIVVIVISYIWFSLIDSSYRGLPKGLDNLEGFSSYRGSNYLIGIFIGTWHFHSTYRGFQGFELSGVSTVCLWIYLCFIWFIPFDVSVICFVQSKLY